MVARPSQTVPAEEAEGGGPRKSPDSIRSRIASACSSVSLPAATAASSSLQGRLVRVLEVVVTPSSRHGRLEGLLLLLGVEDVGGGRDGGAGSERGGDRCRATASVRLVVSRLAWLGSFVVHAAHRTRRP